MKTVGNNFISTILIGTIGKNILRNMHLFSFTNYDILTLIFEDETFLYIRLLLFLEDGINPYE